jgi:hypothetical protein
LVWLHQRASDYSAALAGDDEGLRALDQAIEEGDDNKALAALQAVIWRAAEANNMVKMASAGGKPGSKPRPRPEWWDEEVQAAYDGLRRASLEAAPGEERRTARQRFKSVARRLRRRYTRHVAAAIADKLVHKDSKVYRELLAEQRRRCPTTAISASAWEAHLRQQFTAPPSSQALEGGTELPDGLGIAASRLPQLFDKVFANMRVNTATGLDGLAAPFIKWATVGEGEQQQHLLRDRLQAWFIGMLQRGGMPQGWQPVRIQPIYKKGDPLQPGNYRPIAITSVLYRLYANLVTQVTSHWADQQQLVPPEQFGFQRHRSTTQAAFVLRHAVHARRALGERTKLHCVFVDFAKAYDSVDQAKLWQHLHNLRMPAGLLAAVQKLYDGAVYQIRDGQKCTGQVPCTRGIKQGCPLSPLLFSLYVSDLPGTLAEACPEEGIQLGEHKVQSLLYADDLTLLATTQRGAQRQLDALHGYACSKGLTVNVDKTEVMVFGEHLARQRRPRAPYTYGADKLALRRVAEFRFLGLQQAETGSMQPAMLARVAAMASALQATQRMAARVRLGRHLPTLIRLANIRAVPAGNYGDVVWATAQLQPGECLRNPAQRAVLAHFKHAAGLPPSAPGWPLLQELQLQPLQLGWWQHTLKFFNRAVSHWGRTSPLVHAAMAEEMQRAEQEPRSWGGEFMAALQRLNKPNLCTAAAALQPLNVAEVLAHVQNSYFGQRGAGGQNPRDPAAADRALASYYRWFAPTAGTVLMYARTRTGTRDCRRAQANLRLRLGALPTEVVLGRRSRTPFAERGCRACAEGAGGGGLWGMSYMRPLSAATSGSNSRIDGDGRCGQGGPPTSLSFIVIVLGWTRTGLPGRSPLGRTWRL